MQQALERLACLHATTDLMVVLHRSVQLHLRHTPTPILVEAHKNLVNDTVWARNGLRRDSSCFEGLSLASQLRLKVLDHVLRISRGLLWG